MELFRLASHERNLFAALYLMFGSVLRTLPVSLGSSLIGPLMLIHFIYRERVFSSLLLERLRHFIYSIALTQQSGVRSRIVCVISQDSHCFDDPH